MKKLRNIDLSGYEAEEFDKWLDDSMNKIAKRPPKTKRAWEAEVAGFAEGLQSRLKQIKLSSATQYVTIK